MIPFDPLQFVAVAFVACGLLAVILEIACRDPRDLWDMIDDVRSFAERSENAEAVDHPKNAEPHDPRLSA
jgi:hypothetical protein